MCCQHPLSSAAHVAASKLLVANGPAKTLDGVYARLALNHVNGTVLAIKNSWKPMAFKVFTSICPSMCYQHPLPSAAHIVSINLLVANGPAKTLDGVYARLALNHVNSTFLAIKNSWKPMAFKVFTSI